MLLVAAVISGVLLFAGCTPAQLAPAKMASTVCNVVERGAGVAIVAWESECEKPIVDDTVAGVIDAAMAKERLAAQRSKLATVETYYSALDLACTTLERAIKAAAPSSSGVADDVISLVFSSVAKLLKVLADFGVKVPPELLQATAAA